MNINKKENIEALKSNVRINKHEHFRVSKLNMQNINV